MPVNKYHSDFFNYIPPLDFFLEFMSGILITSDRAQQHLGIHLGDI